MSELRARVDAMRPSTPGPTRTADPRPPDHFPGKGNYFGYIAFGLGSSLMLLVSWSILRTVQALAAGEAAFRSLMESFAHPLYLLFHAICFVWLVWVALRFFSLFPKTQPFRMGPFQRPSDGVLVTGLYAIFAVATLVVSAILAGAIF